MDSGSDMSRGRLFLRLYQANERRIYGFILALVPDWAQAEDLMQETTMVMWSKFGEFEPGTDFAAWALSIARFRVMNHRKHQRAQKIQFSDEVLAAIAEQVSAATENVDVRRDALQDCIRKLAEKDQELLRLRYGLDATVKSVAERVGRGMDAVYKSLNRIHVQLLYCIRRTLTSEGSA
jgi:RNA polymerase sigma-70 factor (ECF subfamily)